MTAVLLALVVVLLCLTQPQSGECKGELTVYSKERNNASLPCENVYGEDCTTTTWIYNSNASTPAFEEVGRGKIKPNSRRRDRLKLGSDCSLNIINVTSQDAGDYRCQQYLKEHGPQHGEETLVYLSILTVSSSIPASELKSDRTVTFYCHLATRDCAQYKNDITIKWADLAPHQVKSDTACNISFTKTLSKQDNNSSLQCTLKRKGELEASVDYTINLQDDGEDDTHLNTAVISAVAGFAAVVLGVFLIIIWRRIAKQLTAYVRSETVSTKMTKEKMEDERKASKPSKEALADQELAYAEIKVTTNAPKSQAVYQETEYASIKTTR